MREDMDTSPIVFDTETCGLANAVDYLEPIPDSVPDESPIEADKRLVDPVKIAADLAKKRSQRHEDNAEAQAKIENRRSERLEQAALDFNVARVVAIGWWVAGESVTLTARTESEERAALLMFWGAARQRMLVGFRNREFDVPMLMQRSLYLDIDYPRLDIGRYARGTNIIDLYDRLTFNDMRTTFVMRRTLKSFCRRLGIPVPDDINGADIAALVAAEDWEAVKAHCAADVALTVALAERLGVVKVPEAAVI